MVNVWVRCTWSRIAPTTLSFGEVSPYIWKEGTIPVSLRPDLASNSQYRGSYGHLGMLEEFSAWFGVLAVTAAWFPGRCGHAELTEPNSALIHAVCAERQLHAYSIHVPGMYIVDLRILLRFCCNTWQILRGFQDCVCCQHARSLPRFMLGHA